MNYTFEIASGGMMGIPSFIKISSGVQKLGEGSGYMCTDSKVIPR
jgi:hypothetical protein